MTTESTQVHNGITVETSKPLDPMVVNPNQIGALLFPEKNKQDGVQYNEPIELYTVDDLVKLDPTGIGYFNARYFLEETKNKLTVILCEHDADPVEQAKKLVGGIDASDGDKTGILAFEKCNFDPTQVAVIGGKGVSIVNQLQTYALDSRCMAWTDATDTTTQDAMNFGGTINSSHVWAVDNSGDRYSHQISPAVIGMAAACKVKPWETPNGAKVPVDRISRPIGYRVTKQNCEGVELNKKGIACVVKDPHGGYMFLGTRTSSGDFGNVIAAENMLLREITKAHRETMSKNLNVSFFKSKIAALNDWASTLVADEAVIGMRIYLHQTRNTRSRYENGEWVLVIEWGAYRPNEHSIVELNQSGEIVENFVENIKSTFK